MGPRAQQDGILSPFRLPWEGPAWAPGSRPAPQWVWLGQPSAQARRGEGQGPRLKEGDSAPSHQVQAMPPLHPPHPLSTTHGEEGGVEGAGWGRLPRQEQEAGTGIGPGSGWVARPWGQDLRMSCGKAWQAWRASTQGWAQAHTAEGPAFLKGFEGTAEASVGQTWGLGGI